MKIKKVGHCCMVLEINGKRVMTDPGSYTTEQEAEKDIDLIVITHEHSDHLHVESLKKIIEHSPKAVVVTNSSVGKILGEAGISYEILEDGSAGEFAGVSLEACGNEHAEIYLDFSRVQNTGYFIGTELFYPGDSFANPGKSVKFLALPVLAPWLKIKESIDYAIAVNPKIAFPVHDWNIKNPSFLNKIPPYVLNEHGIEFKILGVGEEENL